MTELPNTKRSPLLSRREAIRRVGALLGTGTFIGGSRLLNALERGTVNTAPPGSFTVAQVALLDEIAETILPATHTPGAKAAATGTFMALMVTDCYSPAERATFMEGILQIEAAILKSYGNPFAAATPAQRLELLTSLDRDQKRIMDAMQPSRSGATNERHPQVPFFRMMKELALLGFFTSRIGCTQVMRYLETPGRYDPCAPYAPGEPAWAAHA